MAISYARFKTIFGDLGITEWVKYNWLSNAGTARAISNKVVEAGYNPLAYVNDNLYNHITKSINIWDEEWELGGIDHTTGEKTTNNSIIRNKNYIEIIPNTTYYFKAPSGDVPYIHFYDINKNFISYINAYNEFTTPNNAIYILFNMPTSYGNTYNNDICINKSDPYINGNYFPYFEGEKFLVLVGDVDLGSLSWNYNINRYFASVPNDLKPVTDSVQPNWRCDTFEPMPNNISLDTYQNAICYVPGRTPSFYTYATSNTAPKPTGLLDYQITTPVLVDL